MMFEPRKYSVYFAQIPTPSGAVKIGATTNVEQRIRHLNQSLPYDMTLLAAVPGSVALERALHWRFERDHIRGEWFRPSPDLLSSAAAIAAGTFCFDDLILPKGHVWDKDRLIERARRAPPVQPPIVFQPWSADPPQP